MRRWDGVSSEIGKCAYCKKNTDENVSYINNGLRIEIICCWSCATDLKKSVKLAFGLVENEIGK